jgi:hypothetical protein
MIASVSFRLGAASFVLLALPVLTTAGRSLGQGPEPGVLQKVEDAQRAADGKASARVIAAEVRAALLVLRDPDDAHALLRSALDAVRSDPDLSEPSRARLGSRLEWALWGVCQCGPSVKRLQADWLVLKADFRVRLDRWRFLLDPWKPQLGLLPVTE